MALTFLLVFTLPPDIFHFSDHVFSVTISQMLIMNYDRLRVPFFPTYWSPILHHHTCYLVLFIHLLSDTVSSLLHALEQHTYSNHLYHKLQILKIQNYYTEILYSANTELFTLTGLTWMVLTCFLISWLIFLLVVKPSLFQEIFKMHFRKYFSINSFADPQLFSLPCILV